MIRKNLKNLFRRYPLTVVLNFTGLVGAYIAFSLIFLQADYELAFDRCHPTAGRVFRADKVGDESIFRNVLPRGFADDIIASSAHIEAGCAIMPFFGETYFTVREEGVLRTGNRRNLVCVTGGFVDLFGLRMVEGDRNALSRPGTVILPESLARTLFPEESALGKLLHLDVPFLLSGTNGDVTVTGVYADFPSNTQLGNDLYLALGDFQQGSYGGANFVCYLLLDDASNRQAVADEFNGHFDFARYEGWLTPIELIPLTEIYFRNEGDIYKSGSRSQLLLLIAIAVLILAIGLINFTNFYVALTPLRIRSINLQKILGSSTRRLRRLVIGEAVLWCLCAFALSVLLLGPVSEVLCTHGVLMQAFSFRAHAGLLAFVGTVALATGLAAGVWPGIYATSGQPALVLRGNYGLSASGKNLRALLVGVQFVISTALLVFVLFVQRQSRYMQEYPCGYDKKNLAVVDIGAENGKRNSSWLREQLRGLPEVEDVAYSMELVGGSDSYSTETVDFGDGDVSLSMLYCTENFPEVLGMQLSEGRFFNEGSYWEILLTQNTKARGAEMAVYEKWGAASPVVGFLKDLNITSLRKADSPVALRSVNPERDVSLKYAYIRLTAGSDRSAAVARIEKVLQEMDAAFPYELRFYESIGKTLYSGEERLRLAVWLFSLLAVLLSLAGIWGQVMMDVQYRRAEISIKRVFGAQVRQIASEGLWNYFRMVALCYVIAAPAGWIVVRFYLRQFAHRVGFAPSVFLVTLCIVALLCATVVLWHYLKVARTNPAVELKKE